MTLPLWSVDNALLFVEMFFHEVGFEPFDDMVWRRWLETVQSTRGTHKDHWMDTVMDTVIRYRDVWKEIKTQQHYESALISIEFIKERLTEFAEGRLAVSDLRLAARYQLWLEERGKGC